jgi:hypothetical protein
MRTLMLSMCVGALCGAQSPSWSAGVAAGQLKFSDGSSESAVGTTIVAHVRDWLEVSVNPTYAWLRSAAPQPNVSGFTDLPVSVGVWRALPGAWSPSVALGLGVTLPTGDTTIGSGTMAFGASASVGIAPGNDGWFSVSAGRSLSNGFSTALASSASTSLALSGGTALGPVRVSASLTGDVGPVPSGYESARNISAGLAVPVGASMSLGFDGSVGLTKASPTWAYTVGLGTAPSGVVAAAVAPYERLRKAFGAGTGVKNKPKTGKP